MHVCDEFRERITEQIIDRHNFDESPEGVEIRRELLVCSSCADFYTESRDLIDAMSAVQFDIPDDHMEGMAERMRARIHQEAARRPSWLDRLGLSRPVFRTLVPAMAGVAAMALVVVGLYHFAVPVVEQTKPSAKLSPTSVGSSDNTPDAALDPMTVEFLEQSELLLRNVMKLHPKAADDLEEARQTAERQLVGLDQRRAAVSELPPVVNMMDQYEMILREIRHLKNQKSAEDITDIQNRIEKNGLIANMQALQPRVPVVESGSGDNQ